MSVSPGPAPLLIVKRYYNGDTGPLSLCVKRSRAPAPSVRTESNHTSWSWPTSNWFSSGGPLRANHVKTTHTLSLLHTHRQLCQPAHDNRGGPQTCTTQVK